jgi:hypothetical protein
LINVPPKANDTSRGFRHIERLLPIEISQMNSESTLVNAVDAQGKPIGSANQRNSHSRNDSEVPLDPNVTARPGHGNERRGALVPGIPLQLGTPAVTKGSFLAISFPSVPQASEGVVVSG